MVSQEPLSSYRRRILIVGGLSALLTFIVGAVVFVTRIESDLERRVPEHLTASGITNFEVKFSGQEGMMSCADAVENPIAIEDLALEVWGVHSFTLDRSCRVNVDEKDPEVTTSPGTASGGSNGEGPATTAAKPTGSSAKPSSSVAPTTLAVDFDTVADAISSDSQFEALAVRLNDSDLRIDLGDRTYGPVTVFAPTEKAFSALAADQRAVLESSPEIRDAVLSNHVVKRRLVKSDLSDQELTTLGGEVLDMTVTSDAVTVDGATIDEDPITAANGIVYPIDTVLIPPGVELTPVPSAMVVDMTYADHAITLAGDVIDEAVRQQLVTAAIAAVGQDNVIDELTVDAELGVSSASATGLSELAAPMVMSLTAGRAWSEGGSLYVSGRYRDEEGRDVMVAAAESVGATADLEARPQADEQQAQQVEDELNTYVMQNPILFAPGSAQLTAESTGVIENLARRAEQFDGVVIDVQGHTDSEGNPNRNQQLSQRRAEAVMAALVEQGLPADLVRATGFGETQPVMVDGVENKDASRRVVFDVTVT